MTDNDDLRIRNAAFEFLKQETGRVGTDVLPRTLLAQGFQFLGSRSLRSEHPGDSA
jgi:hypothetical protein